MTVPAPVVRLTGVSHQYGDHVVLRDLDLTIHEGERIGLLGPSGAGKTTLLALLNGSLTATSGTVEVFGQPVESLNASALRRLQRRVGSLSQRLDLIDQVRVVHNVSAGRLGRWSAARSLASLVWPLEVAEVREALDQVGMGWAVYEHTERLSGGERQRVAIARLLVQRPDLVLADEPVSSLDPARADEILRLLQVPTRQATLVVSLHQPELARRHCTRAIGLRGGELVFDHDASELHERLLADLYQLQ